MIKSKNQVDVLADDSSIIQERNKDIILLLVKEYTALRID